MKTPIEVICEALALKRSGALVANVAVPEQCAEVYIGELRVHIVAEVLPPAPKKG